MNISLSETGKRVAWITLTSGRKEYLEKTRDSWYELVEGNISEEIIVDTSGDSDYSDWLNNKYQKARIFSLDPKLVIRNDWNMGIFQAYEYFYEVAKNIDCDYILHTEDDYMLLNKLRITDSLEILDSDTNIVQIHFIRQPWSIEEKKSGSVLQNCIDNGFTLTQKDNGKNFWVEHRSYFTFGPSIYRKEICFIDRPAGNNPELSIGYKLFEDSNKKTATFGKIEDANFVEHIGFIKG